MAGLTAFMGCRLRRQTLEIRKLVKALDDCRGQIAPAVRYLIDLLTDIANAAAQSGESGYLLAKRLNRILTSQRGESRSIKDAYILLADFYSAGTLSFLRQNFPDLTPNEISLCGMIALGIEPACIGKVFGYDHIQTFYNKRKTIRKKIGLERGIPLEGFLKELAGTVRSGGEHRFYELTRRY